MYNRITACLLAPVLVLALGPILEARGQNETGDFDPRDFSGIWEIGGASAFQGFGLATRPELTPRAMEIMRDRIPSPGAARFHPLAPEVPFAHLSNDPDYQCNPQGFPKLLIDAEPLEMIMLPDRMLQIFQWEHRIRYIWLDGRELPSGDNLDNLGPAWYGHSVGRWEGDTLVVNTVGLDERAWLDRPGHPVSLNTRIEERYRRISPDVIEHEMTVYDPEFYAGPWPGSPRRFEREPAENYTFFGWSGLFAGITEGICAPVNEVEGYNETFRDPAAGLEN
jgi:hypothetical protein